MVGDHLISPPARCNLHRKAIFCTSLGKKTVGNIVGVGLLGFATLGIAGFEQVATDNLTIDVELVDA